MANPEEASKRMMPETAGSADDLVAKKQKVVVRLGTQEFTNSRQMFETFQGWLQRSFNSSLPIDEVCILLFDRIDGFLMILQLMIFAMLVGCAAVLLDLVKQGHPVPDMLISPGVHSFQVRGTFRCSGSMAFVMVRNDGSKVEFCFRICVNNILPLPEDLKLCFKGRVFACGCVLEGIWGPPVSETKCTRTKKATRRGGACRLGSPW
ncbi:Protein EMBRYO DEFECTIVE 514, partial [Linum grandiflorum]